MYGWEVYDIIEWHIAHFDFAMTENRKFPATPIVVVSEDSLGGYEPKMITTDLGGAHAVK